MNCCQKPSSDIRRQQKVLSPCVCEAERDNRFTRKPLLRRGESLLCPLCGRSRQVENYK